MSEVQALQTVLAAEHAAVYVLGVLGGQTSQSASPGLLTSISESYAMHRGRRDHLTRTLADLGAVPASSQAAYDVPSDVGTPEAVTREALALERSCATTYAFLVGSTTGDLRAWAMRALQMTAVRSLVFRGTPEMFPGEDEQADR
ncbi:ferritin-like domain-containing protein [Nocardioides sp.]|uniref:ferritin-like domain-containing protein n=1 Tax=Nocardioides sp. TaxID=35761 RepID=UPI00286B2A52|nr:ferritin-like domain-containing protein [Nocardioides sp.]